VASIRARTFGTPQYGMMAFKGLLAPILSPALSGTVWAGGGDDFGRSNETLKGEYAFGVTNYAFPLVMAGIKVFDGKGNFAQRDFAGDRIPAEFSPPGQETGTYTVNPDCSGSMVIHLNAPVPTGSTGVIKILFAISHGGRHIDEVVSEFTPPGSSGPMSAQTNADDWKVASEPDD
jgi:hypothetical protein